MKDQIRKQYPKVRQYEDAIIAGCIQSKEKKEPPYAWMHPNHTRKLAIDMGLCKGNHWAHTRALADYLYNTGLCEKLNKIFTERYGELRKPAQYFRRVKGAARKRAIELALQSLCDKKWWDLQ